MCTFGPKAGMVTEPDDAPAAAADGCPAMLPDGLNVPAEPLLPGLAQAVSAHNPATASPDAAVRSVVRRRPFRMSPPVGPGSDRVQRRPTVAKYVPLAGQTLPR